MASDTPAPQATYPHDGIATPTLRAEPADEALALQVTKVTHRYKRQELYEALRARLAAKDESRRELKAMMRNLGVDLVYEYVEGVAVAANWQNIRAEAAEAALAECRAKVIEECAALLEKLFAEDSGEHEAVAEAMSEAFNDGEDRSLSMNEKLRLHIGPAIAAIRALATKEAKTDG